MTTRPDRRRRHAARRAWMARAEECVREKGLHAIIQETSQNEQAVEEKMRVDVHVVLRG
ncbi:hypothetical protein ACWGI8_34170 [Streptomyces sp. NPDC054841]